MAHAEYEESTEAGEPIQLFLFRYGTEAGEYLGYTDYVDEDSDGELVVASLTYLQVPIERDEIESNGTLDKSALKISMDKGADLAELFRVWPPSHVVTLVIAEGHVGDPDEQFIVNWAGRITGADRVGGELRLTGEPVSTSMRRPGLRRHYQYACMHELYGPHCQADKPSKTVSGTVDSIDGATVTLVAGWEGAFDPAKFLGGMLEWPAPGGTINRRTILRVAGDTLSLSGIVQDLVATDAVDVVIGCNHKAYAEDGGDCQPLHNNILNYGGDRWIPTKNPIGTYNNYY